MTRIATDAHHDGARSEAGIDFDDRMVERIERNVDGLFDFLSAVAADPTMIERIPNGAEIVIEHASDPALSAANRQASLKALREGASIHVHHVGGMPALQSGFSRPVRRFRPADDSRSRRRSRPGPIRTTKG